MGKKIRKIRVAKLNLSNKVEEASSLSTIIRWKKREEKQ